MLEIPEKSHEELVKASVISLISGALATDTMNAIFGEIHRMFEMTSKHSDIADIGRISIKILEEASEQIPGVDLQQRPSLADGE